jgi:hypothetical protein
MSDGGIYLGTVERAERAKHLLEHMASAIDDGRGRRAFEVYPRLPPPDEALVFEVLRRCHALGAHAEELREIARRIEP